MQTLAKQESKDGTTTIVPIRFWLNPVEDQDDQSEFKVFKDIEMITLTPDKNTSINKEVDEDIKRRFPEQYRTWIESRDVSKQGIDLKLWPMVTPAEISTLNEIGVHTVEELADNDPGRLPPSLKAKAEQATMWLLTYSEGGKEIQDISTLKKDKETLEKTVKRLEGDVQRLNKALEAKTKK